MRVLVTGAAGFVGRHLVDRLRKDACHSVTAIQRREVACQTHDIDWRSVEIAHDTDWSVLLGGVDVVVHLAARAHVLREVETDPLATFRYANVDSTLNLARQAAAHGVRRFVFLSSIGVNGASSITPFRPADEPSPHSDYAVAKLEAEQAIVQVARMSGMETVIFRAPLIYGPDAPGNFARLVRLVRRGVPLPLASIRNRRSMLSVHNLVDLLVLSLDHAGAANRLFLAADGGAVSTPDILRHVAAGLGKKALLLPFPPTLLAATASLLGKDALRVQLCDSLEIDIDATREILGWNPRVSTAAGIAQAVADYKECDIRGGRR